MEKPAFRFKEEQRNKLRDYWKRPRDREIAAAYLLEVEWIVASWQQKKEQYPPTGVKKQIARAGDLCGKAKSLLASLECLPWDVAELLNIVWLRQKYGEAYFRKYEEACRKDCEHNKRGMALAAAQALVPDRYPANSPDVSELSKLPPDFFKQAGVTTDFLRVVINASQEIATFKRGAKQWHNKEAEENLLYSLALSYKVHFGKLPSAANPRKGQPESAAPFRQFVAELSIILGCKLGADIAREVVSALTKLQRAGIHLGDSAQ